MQAIVGREKVGEISGLSIGAERMLFRRDQLFLVRANSIFKPSAE